MQESNVGSTELSKKVAKLQKELEENPNKEFPPLQNDNLLRAFRGEPVDRIPIWVHRQAGRYMHEFRTIRKEVDFFTVCQTPSLVCEVTLQPIEAFDLDASIIFSDILVILQAIGLEVQMVKGKGPVLPNPITVDDLDMNRLETVVDVENTLGYVFAGITLTRHALEGRVPLIGFTGAPWTLFCYAVEGQSSKTWSKAIRMLYTQPAFSHQIFDLITTTNIDYLVQQVKAGAQALEVFDSWAGILTPTLFNEFCLPYVQRTVQTVKERCMTELGIDIPMTLFAKGANEHLAALSTIGYDTLSIDWTITPARARELVNNQVCLQGNLDPCCLYAPKDTLESTIRNMLDSFGPGNYVANLGHGMLPDHDRTKLEIFIDTVHKHEYSQEHCNRGTSYYKVNPLTSQKGTKRKQESEPEIAKKKTKTN